MQRKEEEHVGGPQREDVGEERLGKHEFERVRRLLGQEEVLRESREVVLWSGLPTGAGERVERWLRRWARRREGTEDSGSRVWSESSGVKELG